MAARVLLLPAALCAICCAASAADPRVSTKSGDVVGSTLKSFLGSTYFSFKGIPYAEPPLGAMRFRAPQPHAGWSGARKAKVHGSKCMQVAMFSHDAIEGAEDCLFVNVYSPQLPTDDQPELPVMVFIHGGGFVAGSGDADMYGPDYLMDQQVVLVTFNYRLGPFGFLTTGDANAPGNYGLHDQVLALEWVQANVAAFGGDPHAVTIFGESAGGSSVGLLVISPLARGLFARAISQSGASFCSFGASGEPQGEAAVRQAELVGCPSGTIREIVGCLRQKPAKEVIGTIVTMLKKDPIMTLPIFYKPRVDRESRMPFLPEQPHVALRDGRFNTVPWLMGMNQNEGAFFAWLKRAKPEAMSVYGGREWARWACSILQLEGVTTDPPATAEWIHRHYVGDADCGEHNLQPLSDMLGDRLFTACVTSEARLAAAHTPVYMYVLDEAGPGRQNLLQLLGKLAGRRDTHHDLGVPHGEDLLYLLKPMFTPPMAVDSVQYKLIRFMTSLWAGFARQGYPSTDVLPMPSWPIYTAGRQEHMRLNLAPAVGRAAFSERVQFWEQLDIQENWRTPLPEATHDEL